MLSRFRTRSRSAGFSLVEVLAALLIAAIMTTLLVRFVGGTRLNAARISQSLEMATMAETLLARVAPGHGLRSGRTDGRSGDLAWRIDVQPIAFTAVAVTVHERRPSAAAENGAGAAKNRAAGTSMRADAHSLGSAAAAAGNWVPYRVAVAIEAPSGRKYVIDTVRVGPAQP